jgi:tight adherence protein B
VTASWLAFAAALFCWPPSRAADRRLRSLAFADRLAGRQPRRLRLRRLVVPFRGAIAGTAVASGVGVGATIGPPIGIAVGCALATAGALLRRHIVHRRSVARDAVLIRALSLICAELDAGSSPAAALATASECPEPIGGVFVAAAHAEREGGDPVTTLRQGAAVAGRLVGLVADAWGVAAESGIALAAVLGRLEMDLRTRVDQRRQVAVAVAGPRACAALLAGLPALGLLLGTALDAQPLAVLTGSTGGQVLGCTGILLDAFGLLWTAHVIAWAERE